jgi:4-hydroxy-tetrahydrodipicolinate synthase
MNRLALAGVLPALATPFRPDGPLDETALARLAERAASRGVAGLVVCGSTGEAAAMRPEEQARALAVAVEAVGSRLPVIAGIGAACTEAAVALAKAAALCGAAGLLVSAPPYVRPGQEGLQAHLRAVARAADRPILLYDVPGRAAAGFSDETVARLAEAAVIEGIKDATGDLARPARLRRLCGAGFAQFSGDDATAAAHLAMGGVGCISVTANLAPALCGALQHAWRIGDTERLGMIRDLLAPLQEALFLESNPIPVKAGLAMLGLADPTPRLPLTLARRETQEALRRAMAEVMPLEEARARGMAWQRAA